MDDVEKAAAILNLPWVSLLTLACGYVGYFIANVGIREHHKTIDVVFITFVFGFLSVFSYQVLVRSGSGILPASAGAFALALVLGAVWNAFGRKLLYRGLRKAQITTDELPTAWMELFSDRKTDVTQVTVKLMDGTWLKCSRTARFDNAPHGAVVFGGAGDLLMYVTHQQGKDEEDFVPMESVRDPSWGDEITYLPKEQIARIDVRKKPRVS